MNSVYCKTGSNGDKWLVITLPGCLATIKAWQGLMTIHEHETPIPDHFYSVNYILYFYTYSEPMISRTFSFHRAG